MSVNILTSLFLIFTFPNLLLAENCSVFRDQLASATASFTECAIKHSRPIKLCEMCVDFYIDIDSAYRNLNQLKDDDGPCIDDYINLDRLQILKTLYSNSADLWSRAKCSECFKVINGSITNNTSDKTRKFNDLFNDLTNCVKREDVTNQTVCTKCMDSYMELNKYYASISNENEQIGVCMDIADLINGTRIFWNAECCKYRHLKEPIYFFLVSAVTIISAIFFYVFTKWSANIKSSEVLKQTRFIGSLQQD